MAFRLISAIFSQDLFEQINSTVGIGKFREDSNFKNLSGSTSIDYQTHYISFRWRRGEKSTGLTCKITWTTQSAE
ncbi:unnamed protein product [Sphenostylis stenocarpa]|uniref:Uncharacterized protein n=1 Tax=Sphenostylis stenocarpa TaxID=92480 RepID=A0AA87BBH6_9FABA|nr:unnamed protein product [Sphenostylis stenocarpa]